MARVSRERDLSEEHVASLEQDLFPGARLPRRPGRGLRRRAGPPTQGRRMSSASSGRPVGHDGDELSTVDRRRAAYRQLIDGELATGDGERVLFFVHSVDLRHASPDLIAAAGLGLALADRGYGVRLVPAPPVAPRRRGRHLDRDHARRRSVAGTRRFPADGVGAQ
ncbi:hypothetical protein [Nocardioides sp. B-3]|uniref:hypothetical protein n=1 Tax=Nocardioides sp. B-3 TaxID=2895565 RepID=UPI002153819D|nr:hypothetical protein [Nocardioides sp. B-3]UUZ59824.1 hypothetical protein LP418_01730 [Nocardioides sp. B-3]